LWHHIVTQKALDFEAFQIFGGLDWSINLYLVILLFILSHSKKSDIMPAYK
jgi:hypothetical protein